VMQSHWGKIAVSVNASQATLAVDDQAPVTLPATVDAPAGLRRLTIRAPGAKVWQGAVLLKGGQTLSIGPLTLGAPDATLRIVSSPSGADVSVAGTVATVVCAIALIVGGPVLMRRLQEMMRRRTGVR